MSIEEHGSDCSVIGVQDARSELERLFADSRFHATERAKKILGYIAERCFEGDTDGVKAYSIALDVLNRPSRFDSNSDPIVRIEVSRLRGALSNYYEAFGAELDITVQIPIGRYVTIFSRSSQESRPDVEQLTDADLGAGPGDVHIEEAVPEQVGRPDRKQAYALVAAAFALAAAGSVGATWFARSPTMTTRPAVMVVVSSADQAHEKEADVAGDYLISAMSQFRTLTISSSKTPLTGSLSQSLRPPEGSSYTIEMKYYADDDDRTVWWQVIDARAGTVLKSGIDKVQVDGRSEAAVRDELSSLLAKRFASTRGVINNLETHEGQASDALGNACVLRGEYELDEGGRTGLRSALECLERTVALQPTNTDALAVLSRVLVAAEGGDPVTAPFDRALTLANRAVSLDPSSDRAQVALMMAHFYGGSTDAAIAAGNRALALNPNNPEVLSKLAGVLYSSGYQAAAVSLAEDATKNVDSVPRDARIVLALDAYGRGDYSNASLIAEQINCSDLVVRAIRAASLGEMASPAARNRLAFFNTMLSDYETSLRTWMERRRYPAKIIASLERGLVKAEQVRSEFASGAAAPAN
jgi:tetratricopeptide (TPR) repeat protein